MVGLYSGRLKVRSEEHTSELQSRRELVCRLLLEKKNRCAFGLAFNGIARIRSPRACDAEVHRKRWRPSPVPESRGLGPTERYSDSAGTFRKRRIQPTRFQSSE